MATISSVLDLSEYVRITNRTGAVIKARYDGRDYVFRPNEPTDVHNLAAVHIFGVGVTDKTAAFHRLGWLNDSSYDLALEKLNDIDFADVPAPAVDIAPGVKRLKRPKTGSPTPLADAGADGGEGVNPSPPDAPVVNAGAAGDL